MTTFTRDYGSDVQALYGKVLALGDIWKGGFARHHVVPVDVANESRFIREIYGIELYQQQVGWVVPRSSRGFTHHSPHDLVGENRRRVRETPHSSGPITQCFKSLNGSDNFNKISLIINDNLEN
jgi:hypothetical protein